jgi:hypothetical protein
MPEFHDRRTGEVSEHNPNHLSGSTETAHSAADRLSRSWMHTAGDHSAVVWTKGNESSSKGARYEGSHVSPSHDGSGLVLHTPSGGQRFSNKAVATVNYVKHS